LTASPRQFISRNKATGQAFCRSNKSCEPTKKFSGDTKMKSRLIPAAKFAGVFCLVLSMMPSDASAQAAGGRGGGGGIGGLQQLRQVMTQLDLTPDQKTKIQGIMKQTMQDARDAMQGLQDATPEERQAKMQDLQKMMADAREKVEAELTPEQKEKYYPLLAKAALKQMTDLVAAIKKAVPDQKLSDDVTKQLNDIMDDTGKTLDGLKTDSDAVKDADGAKDFQAKITKSQMDLRKQIMDAAGQEDGQKLMRAAMQSMRPTGGRGAARETTPTTAPAAK
jgi:Spy/CpxP family protein refolding chaperone